MKTFASVVLMAAVVSAKKSKKMPKPVVVPVVVPEPMDIVIETDEDELFWARTTSKNAYGRNLWLGVYSGLYGMSSKIERPDENCFGDWIPSHMKELSDFKQIASEDIMLIDINEAKKVSYDIVDLVFLNDEYCHFRTTYWNIHKFCKSEETCGFSAMMENMQKNAFGIITQLSTAASIFKEVPWDE